MSYTMKAAATTVFLLLFGAVISAQLVRPVAPSAVPHTVTSGLTGANGRTVQGMIHGTAIDQDAMPLPNATVRLRNLSTHEIEKVSTANELGEFTFVAQPEIPYVVELADQAGQVLAVGNVVTAQPGDVAGAVVSLPARPPAFAGFLQQTAGRVVTAATNAGISDMESAHAPPPASPEN